ncbi:MAG: tRNA (cytidine(56)-2'-O)-methyltransferase [Methanobacteriota archaeon]|nr:MAG: tRNA (cytidine(56)-2'-O)-methyltransferase [Euryarchaeota archaeon]
MVKKGRIVVLRLGHRPARDKRITTHVGLVARCFGADGLVLTVDDRTVIESMQDVCERWGGSFFVDVVSDWRSYMKGWKGVVVHLTMYGLPLDDTIDEIREAAGDVLLVVGAEKVPPDVYRLATYNVSVGSQPHSEVAAVALFLDRYFKGEELKRDFNGRTRVIPSKEGKKAVIG